MQTDADSRFLIDFVIWEPNMYPTNYLSLFKEFEEDDFEMNQYLANL
jgi:hypothetical protein